MWTFSIGNDPLVIVNDAELGKELYRKNELTGRLSNYFFEVVNNEKRTDIVGADYGHTWEALRRVGHSAIQKYSGSEKLVLLASDCVDRTMKMVVEKEGLNKPFNPLPYIYQLFFNILSTSAFGRSYDMNDKEYKQLKYVMKDMLRENGIQFIILQFVPIMRYVFRDAANKQHKVVNEMIDMLSNKFTKHYVDYDESVCRDFCDALITAKNEALREGKESAPYLTDENLTLVVFDLFFAGTDTSQMTFQWLLLFLSYYPSVQRKLRQEIETQIGDRMPTHEDRNRCHYVMAFISETMRLRN
ncbi:unnamed protein product, partial [Oppiella nova]